MNSQSVQRASYWPAAATGNICCVTSCHLHDADRWRHIMHWPLAKVDRWKIKPESPRSRSHRLLSSACRELLVGYSVCCFSPLSPIGHLRPRCTAAGFYPRDAMLARVFATALCPSVCLSVCLSVTSRCSIKRDVRVNLVLALKLLSTSHTLCFKEIQVFTKIGALLSGTFFLNSGRRKLCHGILILERAINLARERWTLKAW